MDFFQTMQAATPTNSYYTGMFKNRNDLVNSLVFSTIWAK